MINSLLKTPLFGILVGALSLSTALFSFSTHAASAWTPAGTFTGGAAGHSATLLPSGQVLVVGGASADIFDPNTKTWLAAKAPGSERLFHTATLLNTGQVLVAGGSGASAELYDSATDTWTSVASMAESRFRHTATLLPSGKVLIAGGFSGSSPTASAELFDLSSGSWSTVSALPGRRYDHTATLLQSGEVLVVGGNNFMSLLSEALIYNSDTNSWRSAGTLSEGRSGHTATLLASGNVLVIGGEGGMDINRRALASADLFSPSSGGWSQVAPLPQARRGHSATALNSGEVLVVAGWGSSAVGEKTSVLFDPGTNAWQARGPLDVGRYGHTATRLQSGEVLVVGGSRSAPRSAELFAATRVSHQIAVSSQGSGSLAPNSNVTVLDGDVATFAVSPQSGHTVSMGGSCAGSLSENVFTTSPITSDCTVEANFAIRKFNVTVTAGPGGSVLPASNQVVDFGGSARFEIAPSVGHKASVGGTCAGSLAGNIFTTQAIEADCSVIVEFNNPLPTLTTPITQGLLEDQTSSPIAIELSDFETPASELVLTGSSSNPSLISNTSLASNLAGSGSTRHLTLVPEANQFGSAAITLSVTDGSGTSSTFFWLQVFPVNDAPSLSLLGNRSHGAVASAQHRVEGFATSHPGPNEVQSVSYITTKIQDPSGIVEDVQIHSDGSLHYRLTGNHGVADILVVARDDGGTAVGGRDESASERFRIVVGDGANMVVQLRRIHPTAQRLSDASSRTQLASYEVRVVNNGPQPVTDARVQVSTQEGLKNVLWECPSCLPSNGSTAADTRVNLNVHDTALITLSGSVVSSARFVEIIADATPPSGVSAISSQEQRVVLTEPIDAETTFRNGLE